MALRLLTILTGRNLPQTIGQLPPLQPVTGSDKTIADFISRLREEGILAGANAAERSHPMRRPEKITFGHTIWWREHMEAAEIDEKLARLRTHRNNIHRYRRLLETRLTDLERQYLERRLSEEQSAMEMLKADLA